MKTKLITILIIAASFVFGGAAMIDAFKGEHLALSICMVTCGVMLGLCSVPLALFLTE